MKAPELHVKFFPSMENTQNSSALVVIPARFASSRFPGKPLALIWGKPMIQWVWEGALKSGLGSVVVTDDQRIAKVVEQFGGNFWLVEDDVSTGSERVALGIERNLQHRPDVKFIINLQGDEPLIDGRVLNSLVHFHQNSAFDIVTLVKRQSNQALGENPNVVKALFSTQQARCLAFSRSRIPFFRDTLVQPYFYQHIGVYCYRREALGKFVRLPMGELEKIEMLEQMRALENGMSIGALETGLEFLGVDTPEDILKVEEKLNGKTQ